MFDILAAAQTPPELIPAIFGGLFFLIFGIFYLAIFVLMIMVLVRFYKFLGKVPEQQELQRIELSKIAQALNQPKPPAAPHQQGDTQP